MKRASCSLVVLLSALQLLVTFAVTQPGPGITYDYNRTDLLGSCPRDIAATRRSIWVSTGGCGPRGSYAYLWKADARLENPSVIEPLAVQELVGCWIVSVSFVNEEVGWILLTCGSRGDRPFQASVLRTDDGGSTWRKISTADDDRRLRLGTKIIFVSEKVGWILSQVNRIYQSRDGGMSWQEYRIPLPGIESSEDEDTVFSHNAMGDAIFVSTTQGWVSGPWNIFRTTDGGESWSPQLQSAYESGKIVSLDFVGSSEGWACGTSSLLHTTDAGKVWQEVKVSFPELKSPHRFTAIKFVDRNLGYVAGEVENPEVARILASGEGIDDFYLRYGGARYHNPFLLYTTDGGRSWGLKQVKMPLRRFAQMGHVVYGIGSGAAIVRIEPPSGVDHPR